MSRLRAQGRIRAEARRALLVARETHPRFGVGRVTRLQIRVMRLPLESRRRLPRRLLRVTRFNLANFDPFDARPIGAVGLDRRVTPAGRRSFLATCKRLSTLRTSST